MTETALVEIEHESGNRVTFENCISAEELPGDAHHTPLVIEWIDDDGTRRKHSYNAQTNHIARVDPAGGIDDE